MSEIPRYHEGESDELISATERALINFDRTAITPSTYEARTVRIYESPTNPEVLIREHLPQEGHDPSELMQHFHEAKQLFSQIRDQYNIRIVDMDAKLATNRDGQETLFIAVDRIHGEALEAISALPPEAQEELETLYCSLADYYTDCWKTNARYWGDCSNGQFVYGTKPGDHERHFYLVDIGAQFYSPGENIYFPLALPVRQILRGILESEQKFHPPVQFSRARARILGLLNALRTEDPKSKFSRKTWALSRTKLEEKNK